MRGIWLALLTGDCAELILMDRRLCAGSQLILDTDGTGIGPGTPSFHDINNPRYANCTVCHFEIHGSNKDPFFR
jgi:hypothetical protein